MCVSKIFGQKPKVENIAPPPRTEDLTDPTKGADELRRKKKTDRASTILTGEGVLQPANTRGTTVLGGN